MPRTVVGWVGCAGEGQVRADFRFTAGRPFLFTNKVSI